MRVGERWDTIENPTAYLRVAVVNACPNHQRRRRIERRQLVVAGVTIDDRFELRDALARLPIRQRSAVVLRYCEDLPEAEIAELTDRRVPPCWQRRRIRSLVGVYDRTTIHTTSGGCAMAMSYVMRVSRNGQVSIPAATRSRWGSERVVIVDLGDRIVVRPLPPDPVDSLRGKYRAVGPDSDTSRQLERRAAVTRERHR